MASTKPLSNEQLLAALAQQLQAPEAPNTKALKEATALFQKSADFTRKAQELHEQAMALLSEASAAPVKKNKPGAGRPRKDAVTDATSDAPSLFSDDMTEAAPTKKTNAGLEAAKAKREAGKRGQETVGAALESVEGSAVESVSGNAAESV